MSEGFAQWLPCGSRESLRHPPSVRRLKPARCHSRSGCMPCASRIPPRRTLRLLLIITSLLPGGVLPAQQRTPPARLLFIGNSYTYWNDLPLMVRALADSAGLHRFQVEAVTAPGAALLDLWGEGAARNRIATGQFDLVIMQQGPSSQPEGRQWLLAGVDSFAPEIRRAGGRPALYMVWPSRDRQRDFDATRESYTLAAERVGGMLFPAGEAWRAAWRRDSTLSFYSRDDLHPTPLGSYLTALVIVGELTGRSPVELPSRLAVGGMGGYTLVVPEPVATLLKAAAAEAIGVYGRR